MVEHKVTVISGRGDFVGVWRAQCLCGWRDEFRDKSSDAWSHALDHKVAREMVEARS